MHTKLKIDSDDLFRLRLEEKSAMSAEHARKCCASAAEAADTPRDKRRSSEKIKVGKPAFHPKF